MSNVQIHQPIGLGDIFFSQKIAKTLVKNGHKVIWPTRKEYLWLNEYLPSYNITYIDENKTGELEFAPDYVIDLKGAGAKQPPGTSVLEAKYNMVKMDYKDWSTYFTFNRYPEKEKELFYKLGLKDNEEYVLRSQMVGTPPDHRVQKIEVNNNLKVVDICLMEDYNVIDWCYIIENATEIAMVDTVFNYLMEKLNLKAQKIDLYSRFGVSGDFLDIKNLFKVNYTWK